MIDMTKAVPVSGNPRGKVARVLDIRRVDVEVEERSQWPDFACIPWGGEARPNEGDPAEVRFEDGDRMRPRAFPVQP